MGESNFEKLRDLIVEQSGVYDEEVTPDARLYDDLGIYGDDAYELLVKYGKKFDVDVSKFMAADYFKGDGGLNLIDDLVQLFTEKILPTGLKALTVKDLEKGILADRLDEDVIKGI